MSETLTIAWSAFLAFAVFMYVLMDGFDLGIGVLFPFAPEERFRDTMMDSVAPVWDGNETWLVLGGVGLFAAFPVAYGTVLPALYFPLLLMLIALVFRGVAFEFRSKAHRSRGFWNRGFHLGSLVATLSQGVVLGAFVQGIDTEGRQFVGGLFDWLTPFSLFVGVALVVGYALLGATWLILKTEDGLQLWAYRVARRLVWGLLAAIAVVSLWTPLLNEAIAQRWFSWPNLLYLSPVPLATAAAAAALLLGLRRGRELAPFLLTMTLFGLSYLGLGVSLWPYVVPPDITVFEAAADPASQIFLLVGVALLVPVILLYTGFTYYVFRGKVRPGEGYH